MVQRDYRPLTEEEREWLRPGGAFGCMAWSLLGFVCFLGVALGGITGTLAGGVLGLLLEQLGLPRPFALFLLLGGGALGGLIGLAHSLDRFRKQFRPEPDEEERRDLEDGRMEVLTCEVLDAVAVEPCDWHQAPACFLDVGHGELLFLRCEALAELEAEGRFPNRKVRLSRTPHGWFLQQLECLGEPFPPSRVISGGALDDGLDGPEWEPASGEFLRARLETLEADLRRLASPTDDR